MVAWVGLIIAFGASILLWSAPAPGFQTVGPTSTLGQVFLAVWAVMLSYVVVTMVFRREEIVVDDQAIRRRFVLGPYPTSRTKSMALSQISNVRAVRNLAAAPRPGALLTRAIDTRERDVGAIAFDFDRVPHRFGFGLDEAEAAELIARIKEFAPVLADARGHASSRPG